MVTTQSIENNLTATLAAVKEVGVLFNNLRPEDTKDLANAICTAELANMKAYRSVHRFIDHVWNEFRSLPT